MKKLHLICNAHIDPIWLWEWEEGASTAISTFRSAADLAEKFNYIFCHNEVTLYEWVREYEPALFDRIQKLVIQGKWHVMGGWYLQPDCNMPSGEAMVRQIMAGRNYFKKHFASFPTTAVNVDPFGHSYGLVQIMKKCGFDSYLFCRPFPEELEIEDTFIWRGPDGSEICCFRASKGYNSPLGEAVVKIQEYLDQSTDLETGMLLWGVGNHGGGPSAKDLRDIEQLMNESEVEIIHSTPEKYFLDQKTPSVVLDKSLYPSMVGCYSSQIHVKQTYRLLENQFFTVERMCAAANSLGLMDYPDSRLYEVLSDLLNAQFHDILPGSSIREGEKAGIRLMEHGLEILSRLRASAFFAFSAGEKCTPPGEYTILVFNPHPFKIETEIQCELQLENQNWDDSHNTSFEIFSQNIRVPSQIIKEDSNLNLDWRKRLFFHCTLAPFSINRFDCRPVDVQTKDITALEKESLDFDNGNLKVTINHETGLIDSMHLNGRDYIAKSAFLPIVIKDTVDPWALSKQQRISLGEKIGAFTLMGSKEAADYMGNDTLVDPVHIVENGEVATIVEAVFNYNYSYIVVNYILYKLSNEIDIKYTVFWNEKSKALKIAIPTLIDGEYMGETLFATETLPNDGREVPSQRWSALSDGRSFLGILNNGTYSSSCQNSEIQLTLLRSPCYAAYPITDRKIVPDNRFVPRIDQGEHHFDFKICFGDHESMISNISRKAQVFNETPYALNVFPSGTGQKVASQIIVENSKILLTAYMKDQQNRFILRLFNSCGTSESTNVQLPLFNIEQTIDFTSYEFKTFIIGDGILTETTMPLI